MDYEYKENKNGTYYSPKLCKSFNSLEELELALIKKENNSNLLIIVLMIIFYLIIAIGYFAFFVSFSDSIWSGIFGGVVTGYLIFNYKRIITFLNQ